MKEMRLHGRGGQGAAMAAEMLATAFVVEGKHAHSFPMFGVERRGAPLASYVRYGEHPIRVRMRVYQPDNIIVLDPALVREQAIYQGLKKGGMVVVNATKPRLAEGVPPLKALGVVDATGIALETMGNAITNTCMLGAFARTSGDIGLNAVLEAIAEYFTGELRERNQACARRGYEEVQLLPEYGVISEEAALGRN